MFSSLKFIYLGGGGLMNWQYLCTAWLTIKDPFLAVIFAGKKIIAM